MEPYQEEYIANLREIAALSPRRQPSEGTLADYTDRLCRDRARQKQLAARNMALLRENLFPVLDNLPQAGPQETEDLRQFAAALIQGRIELDAILYCQIHQSLLGLARHRRDRDEIIRELYSLGIGRYAQCSKLVGLDLSVSAPYTSQMRLCFVEAAAYLKYFDEIQDPDTRGYILRSLANTALGQFRVTSERVRLIKNALQIMQDPAYREREPSLPWDRFVRQTHRLMTASISFSRETAMTAQDVADIMESVYAVYDLHAQAEGAMAARPAFHYYAIEYYCGLDSMEGLLSKTERLLNSADLTDFSVEGMYAVISLTAFYCQYLQEYPEMLAGREEIVEEQYRRVMRYTESFPPSQESESLLLYLRQLSYTYVETSRSLPYGLFLQKLIFRFAPEIYLHSQAVGAAAAALCRQIAGEEPGFFDDIPAVREISNPQEKLREIQRLALASGQFHDVGKINFTSLYANNGRQWFEEEHEMSRLHPVTGAKLLADRPSTSPYADAALGHHAWYDGSRDCAYRRLECASRQMVDVVALVDWLENVTSAAVLYTGIEMSFDEAVQEAIRLEGRRFSPLLTARLRERQTAELIRSALDQSRRETAAEMFDAGA